VPLLGGRVVGVAQAVVAGQGRPGIAAPNVFEVGVITRSRTGQMQVRTRGELEELGNALLEPLFPLAKGIRLLGISLSSLAAEQAEREPEFTLPA
jgi:hypothetical protein